jgi:hypothetical protein
VVPNPPPQPHEFVERPLEPAEHGAGDVGEPAVLHKPPPPPPPPPAQHPAPAPPAPAQPPPPQQPPPQPHGGHDAAIEEDNEGGGGGGAADKATGAVAALDDPLASFGGAADLAWHRGNDQCWRHFDFGFVEEWQGASALFCSPPAGTALDYAAGNAPGSEAALAAPGASSWLRCRVTTDGHLPPATAPHTLCDGANVVLDVGRLTPTVCLPSRPGYKCDGPPVHWGWGPGALGGACTPQPPFHPGAFPRDHLMDTFTSWTGPGGGAPPPPASLLSSADLLALPASHGPVVLLVARERGEHANAFHATTDFLNAFVTLHAAGVIAGHSGSRAGMERVQVLLLDEQAGPFDDAYWGRVFSPAHPVMRVSTLQAAAAAAGGAGARLRLPRALFVPPGYTNMLLSHVASEGDCHAGTQLFQSYRRFVLGGMGVDDPAAAAAAAADAGSAGGKASPLTVTFISRRPYSAFVDHAFVGRQVDNEDAVLGAMAAACAPGGPLGGCNVSRVDFAQLDARAQVATMAGSDVVVGMHGAALTQTLYQPPWGGLLELWPKPADMWRCFEHVAAMSGLVYERWENRGYPDRFRQDGAGDYTTVDVGEFAAVFARVAGGVRARKDARHTPERAAAAGAG